MTGYRDDDTFTYRGLSSLQQYDLCLSTLEENFDTVDESLSFVSSPFLFGDSDREPPRISVVHLACLHQPVRAFSVETVRSSLIEGLVLRSAVNATGAFA